MQDTGQVNDKKSYRVILLLVIGLASFTSAMKELNQVRDLTLEATNFVARWKDAFAPAGELTTVSVETCQNSKLLTPPPPPKPEVPPVPPIAPSAPTVQFDNIDVVPLPEPPALPTIRVIVRPKRVQIREGGDLNNAVILIHKRDKRSDG